MNDSGSENGENDGTNGGSENGGDSDRSQNGTDDEGPSTTEKVVIAISVTFTVLLFAYVVWQAAVTPSAVAPEASIVGTTPMEDGSVRVTVELVNEQDVGLVSATVEVNCTSPPPSITFEHVPADGRTTGYVVCPSGTFGPSVSVSTWVEA